MIYRSYRSLSKKGYGQSYFPSSTCNVDYSYYSSTGSLYTAAIAYALFDSIIGYLLCI